MTGPPELRHLAAPPRGAGGGAGRVDDGSAAERHGGTPSAPTPADGPGPPRPDRLGTGWDRARAPRRRLDLRRRRDDALRRAVGSWRWFNQRWRRSLQLRVAATTVLISSLVVIVVGMLSVGTITAGV
ncbi:MAG TPA: hypothetical protein VNC79_01740, partial [Mycobacteriales bacterium]|nr:hypothetical protein [Mycobacteriales bacterium]